MNNKELKPTANIVGVGALDDPHFGENTLESPTAYTNSKSKIKTLTSDNKGITLIALVITIIVMLILVAVTVTIAINGGLFKTAKQAKADTQKEIDKEQELSNERVEIDGVWYDSFDEYLAGKESPNQGKGNWTLSKEGDTVTSGDVTLKIGDYVNYKPNEGTYPKNKLTEDYTGNTDSSYNKSDLTTESLKWRVLGVDTQGCLTLISSNLINKAIRFEGATGYNNGVYILNDICKTLYSNTDLGVTARSITIEDIEAGFNDDAMKKREAYKTLETYDNYKTYPVIYKYEEGSEIDGKTAGENAIGGSDPYYTESTLTSKEKESDTASSNLTCTQTFYFFDPTPENYCKNSVFYNMIFKTNSTYWLASRCVACQGNTAAFGLFRLGNTVLRCNTFFDTDNTTNSGDIRTYSLRPVIPLGSNITIEPVSNNSYYNPHKITDLE